MGRQAMKSWTHSSWILVYCSIAVDASSAVKDSLAKAFCIAEGQASAAGLGEEGVPVPATPYFETDNHPNSVATKLIAGSWANRQQSSQPVESRCDERVALLQKAGGGLGLGPPLASSGAMVRKCPLSATLRQRPDLVLGILVGGRDLGVSKLQGGDSSLAIDSGQ